MVRPLTPIRAVKKGTPAVRKRFPVIRDCFISELETVYCNKPFRKRTYTPQGGTKKSPVGVSELAIDFRRNSIA